MTQKHRSGSGLAAVCGVVLAIGAAAWGIWSRARAESALVHVAAEGAIPTVSVISAQPGPATEELVLPGTIRAEYETPIYARTSGYVKRWHTDIGSRVKAGALLAEIDSPEIDRELNQAKADLKTAQANESIARITAGRVHALLPTQSVSAEQDDQAASDLAARTALVASAQANVERLTELVKFERVVAPYDGVVTARETDIGALINAGSGIGPELFRVADISKLRVYVQVPQSYATSIKPGIPVELQLPEYPGRTFPVALTRTADAIDPVARTLLVELQRDNHDGELLPGGYADVHFKLPVPNQGVRIPANALLFRAEGLRVATVADDGTVSLHRVTTGRDFGTAIEILTGVAPGASVILNPSASLVDGARVRVQDNTHGADSRS